MIFYKEEEKERMLKDIKDWIEMGMSAYSIFPVEGGYLLNLRCKK